MSSSIEQQVFQTYENNIQYFQEKHPEVAKKIFLLETAIQQGQYSEKYSLEYKNEGYFDVLDRRSKTYLYNNDSNLYGREAAETINQSKTEHVIETYYKYDFTDESAEASDKLPVTISSFSTVAPVIHYVNQNIPKQKPMKRIYKFMILGVGLGTHIAEIDKKIRSNLYFIVEDDLELFRLSLFVTDYASLGSETELYFSIMENRTAFIGKFNDFFHSAFIRNHYLKFYCFSSGYAQKIKEIQNAVVTQSHLTYTHNRLLYKSLRVLDSLQKGYQFLNISSHFQNFDLQRKPLLFIAAGPSLEQNISWLRENHERFIIFTVFMALPILEEHEIVPDIVLHIDEGAEPIQKTLDKITFDRLDQTIFIFAPSIPLTMFEPYIDKFRIFLVEDRTHFKHNYGNITAMSVGEAGYTLSLLFGMQEIYLLGLDLALGEDGQTHSQGHTGRKEQKIEENRDIEDVMTLRNSLLKIRGNFREYVYTTPLFDGSIHILNQNTKAFKKHQQKVFNLCDGARFEDIEPLHSEDVDLSTKQAFDKKLLKSELLQVLKARASTSLSARERELFRLRLDDARSKLQEIEMLGQVKYASLDSFQEAFNLLSAKLIMIPADDTGELAQIYNIYLHYIGGYVTDMTNTEGISNPKRHIKKFQKILARQLKKFAEVYIPAIEVLIEEEETELLEA